MILKDEDSVESLIKDRESLWHIIVNQSRDGIVLLDQNGKVFEANIRYAIMLGYSLEELYNLHVWDWDTQFSKEELEEKIKEIDYDGHHFETSQRRKDGSTIDVECSNSATIFKGQKLIFCICRDVTKRKQLEKEVYLLATTDLLTGLSNRMEFQRRLKQEIYGFSRYGNVFSVIMYDLDFFKRINDTFGHLEGDNVLRVTSGLVKDNIRATDVATRWGGEEFMILMPQTNISAARSVAEKIRCSIESHQFHESYRVTASFGVVEYQPGDDVNSLLKRVDDALYVAKSKGRNCIEVLN